MTASGGTWRTVAGRAPDEGAPGRKGFSRPSSANLGRLSAGLGPMAEISSRSLVKTAENASANSLADWKRWVMSRSSALSNQW